MATRGRQYLVIDLKSFYASVECVERGLDPLEARLVVADPTRTEKPSVWPFRPHSRLSGVRNRCRVFEIPKSITYVMAPLAWHATSSGRQTSTRSICATSLPEDIHVYSIDEAFLDVTGYLDLYGCTARSLGERIREDVVRSTGIPAACGLGTNLYLAKVAL